MTQSLYVDSVSKSPYTVNMNSFIFRVSLKNYGDNKDDAIVKAKADAIQLSTLPGVEDLWMVYEEGDAEGKHAHGFIKLKKTRNTLVSYLKRCFEIPDGNAGFSIKAANTNKMPAYLKYCAKGYLGTKGSPVEVIYEKEVHLWDMLHDQYHNTAEEIKAREKGKYGCEAFFVSMAEMLKAQGKTSKEDVLSEVTNYYVNVSKKGFEKFAVMRCFWRVFSLVSQADAQAMIYEQCAEALFKC